MAARNKSERITVRLTADQLRVIDALIQVGEVENRSLAVRHALKDYVEKYTGKVELLVQKKKEQDKMLELAAKMAELQEFTET